MLSFTFSILAVMRCVLWRSVPTVLPGLLVLGVAACDPGLEGAAGTTDLSALPVIDLAAPDLLPPNSCLDDGQCGGATPRCDPGSRTCVPCLPQNDNCCNGQRCVKRGGSFVCTSTCEVDADCPRSDAGAPSACCGGACIDVMVDARHCGACGNACAPLPGASPACVGGACVIGTCDAGRLDCDHLPANGCEVDAQTDAMNCGACNTACAVTNARAACQKGACTVGECNPGVGDCNHSAMDGCEIDLGQDPGHCDCWTR